MDQMLTVPHYRYKLNKNAQKHFKIKDDEKWEKFSTEIQGVIVRSRWVMHRTKKSQLDAFIRTHENKDGLIDYQLFIPATGQIVEDPTVKPKTPKSYYRSQDLLVMNREELIEVCKSLGISTKQRTNKVLIRDIMENNKVPVRKRNKKGETDGEGSSKEKTNEPSSQKSSENGS